MAKKTFADRAESYLTPSSKKGYAVQVKRSDREKEEVAQKICNLVATNKYTLESICGRFNVNYLLFMQWACPTFDLADALVHDKPLPRRMIPKVHSMYRAAQKMAQQVYMSDLKEKSRIGLMRLVEGVPYEETVIEEEIDTVEFLPDGEPNPNFGQMKVVKRKVKSGIHKPDVGATIFALTNVDADNFKNSKFQKIDGKIDHTLTGLENMSDEELMDKRRELEARIMRFEKDRNDRITDADIVEEGDDDFGDENGKGVEGE